MFSNTLFMRMIIPCTLRVCKSMSMSSPVLRTLREHDISPSTMCSEGAAALLHVRWGVDGANKLAEDLEAALGQLSVSRRAEEGKAMRLRHRSSRCVDLAVLVTLALTPLGTLAQTTNAADKDEVQVDFEGQPAGGPSPLFESGLTGKGRPARWELLRDESAPNGSTVLAETSGDRTSDRFPLAILKGFEARDVEVKVRFKLVSGKVDQTAGLVVRLRDPANYYIARANALEGNVRLYKVVGGKRQQLAGDAVTVLKGKWQELGLTVEGDRLTVLLDGLELFSAADRTFAEAGRVGVWSKADSLTHFDDLVARRLP
jgi:hypothetical protein